MKADYLKHYNGNRPQALLLKTEPVCLLTESSSYFCLDALTLLGLFYMSAWCIHFFLFFLHNYFFGFSCGVVFPSSFFLFFFLFRFFFILLLSFYRLIRLDSLYVILYYYCKFRKFYLKSLCLFCISLPYIHVNSSKL